MGGRWRRATEDETGSSAIEMVILFPVTLLVVLLIIQFGVWYHAAAIARAAAQQGVKTASAYGATAGAGQTQADVVLDDNGRSLIQGTKVTPFRDGTIARMTVTGTALPVVPILHLPIHEAATAPVEAFRPPPGP